MTVYPEKLTCPVSFDLGREVCSVLMLKKEDRRDFPRREPYQELVGEKSDGGRSSAAAHEPHIAVDEVEDEDSGQGLRVDDFFGDERGLEDAMDEG